jgi:hypothetical protein
MSLYNNLLKKSMTKMKNKKTKNSNMKKRAIKGCKGQKSQTKSRNLKLTLTNENQNGDSKCTMSIKSDILSTQNEKQIFSFDFNQNMLGKRSSYDPNDGKSYFS